MVMFYINTAREDNMPPPDRIVLFEGTQMYVRLMDNGNGKVRFFSIVPGLPGREHLFVGAWIVQIPDLPTPATGEGS